MSRALLAALLFLSLFTAAGAEAQLPAAVGDGPVLLLAQRKPHDLGNCFSVIGCKGDSIGMMWVDFADFCKSMGGRSWMDTDGQCYNLPPGPQNIVGPNHLFTNKF